jgi:hypothetical protein
MPSVELVLLQIVASEWIGTILSGEIKILDLSSHNWTSYEHTEENDMLLQLKEEI